MTQSRPVIGIPAAMGQPSDKGYVYQQVGAPYIQAIEQCGATPMLLPVTRDPEVASRLLDLVDGIVFQGGGDIAPHLYGQACSAEVVQFNEDTDRFELDLCREALERDIPVLAICRGVQILNVAAGGTLVQDLTADRGIERSHRQSEPRDRPSHPIHVVPGSRLARILGQNEIGVNSMHHQAVDQLGEGMAVAAVSDDDVIEAIEAPNKEFVIGVQFHPEETVRSIPSTARLFEELIAAARLRAEED